MTPTERVQATLAGEPTDRPPVIGGFVTNPDFYINSRGITPDEFWNDPEPYALETFKAVEADVIVQFVMPKPPETTTQTSSGRTTNFSRQDHSWRELYPDPDAVIDYVRSHPDTKQVRREFDAQGAYDFYTKYMLDNMRKMDPMVWIPGHVNGCPGFQHGYDQFGYENYLTAMLEEPGLFRRYFDALAEQKRIENEEAVRATRNHDLLPLVYCGQDICYGAGPICNPELLRDIYFPGLRYAFEPLREADFEIVWHSDGYIMPIIDDLLDAGVTGFQGLEEDHGMSLEELAQMTSRSGKPLVIWGSVSVTSSLPWGSEEDVRADVARCVEIGRRTGARMFIAPSSSVGPEVPVGNINAFFDEARRAASPM
jgi:hypothetical protein